MLRHNKCHLQGVYTKLKTVYNKHEYIYDFYKLQYFLLLTNQELRESYKGLDIVAGIKKKTLEWVGLVVKWVREGQLRKYLRVNRKEVEEVEDLDLDGWNM